MEGKDSNPNKVIQGIQFEPELLRIVARRAKKQNLTLSSYINRLISQDMNYQHSSTFAFEDGNLELGEAKVKPDKSDDSTDSSGEEDSPE